MPFDILFTERFKNQFLRLPEQVKKPARKAVELLSQNPRYSSLTIHP